MKVTVFKYILRDLDTMKKVGIVRADYGHEPVAPPGTFVGKCIGSEIVSRPDKIVEVNSK